MSNDSLFYAMTLAVPVLTLIGIHIVWRSEFRGYRMATICLRSLGWLVSVNAIFLWALFAGFAK